MNASATDVPSVAGSSPGLPSASHIHDDADDDDALWDEHGVGDDGTFLPAPVYLCGDSSLPSDE